jgi:hypothetical protein
MILFSSLLRPFSRSLLLLALLGNATAALAQPRPAANRWHVEPGTKVYLDGLPSTPAAISALPDAAIASAEGMGLTSHTDKSKLADYQHEYLVITTKANANSPTTLALADKLHLSSAHTTRPAPLSAIAPTALAYITSHYPKYWLGGEVLEMTRKSTGAVQYRVQLADNWGWRYVSFTEAGDFVDDGKY